MEAHSQSHLQEKQAWEYREKQLRREITNVTQWKSEIEKRWRQTVKDNEALQERLDTVTKEAESNLTTWDEQRSEAMTLVKEFMEVTEVLHVKVLELSREKKRQEEVSESRLRHQLEEEEERQRFDKMHIASLTEELDVLRRQQGAAAGEERGEHPQRPPLQKLFSRGVRGLSLRLRGMNYEEQVSNENE